MRHLGIVTWVLAGIVAVGCPGQELEPAMDVPAAAAPEAEAPRARHPRVAAVATRFANASTATGERVRTATLRAATAANPRRVVDQARANYRDGRFYSTDFSEHPSRRAAVAHSIKPLDLRANVRASFRNNASPINLVGSLIGPASMELNRQLATDGRISLSKLATAFEPGAIVGGLAAGVAADAGGAAVQSALAGTMGPFGPIAGFLARPAIGYAAFLIGSNFGRGVQHGKPSVKGAFAQSLRQVDPARDAGMLVGGSVGAVVGQALIPIPVLGGVAGGMVGGMIGGAVGNWIGRHGITGRLNQASVRWLGRRADGLEGKGRTKGGPTAPADRPSPGPDSQEPAPPSDPPAAPTPAPSVLAALAAPAAAAP